MYHIKNYYIHPAPLSCYFSFDNVVKQGGVISVELFTLYNNDTVVSKFEAVILS